MPNALVALFYVWLFVSVGVLLYRMVTRRRRRAPVVTSTAKPPMVPSDWAPPDPAPAPPSSPPTAAAGPPADWPAAPPTAPPQAPPTTPPASPPAAPPPTVPPSSPPVPGAGAGAGATSLMDALAGITLPCDLVPLTSAEGRVLGDRELLLITSGHTAFEVGRAMGEAVAALGYALTPMANNDLVAIRGNDRVGITIHDRPDGLLAGKLQEFPTAKPGDVVVELRL